MAKVKFVLDRTGVGDLLKSAEMEKCIEDHVRRVKANCGSEYESSVQVGRNRIQGRVETATEHAFYSNLHNNTLLKGLR